MTIRGGSVFLFLTSVMVLPRSYVFIKIAFLGVFLLLHAKSLIKDKGVVIHFRIFYFYFVIALLGLVWSYVGLVNGGAWLGVIDNLKLYVLWSIAFIIIFNFLLQDDAFFVFHRAIILSGILISVVNLAALFDYVYSLNFFSADLISELNMRIGIHDGYVQITSHNIGSLFFITSYLIALQFRDDMSYLNGFWVKLSLLLCVLLVLLSGRRALWLSIMLTPFIMVAISTITGSLNKIRGLGWLISAILACFISLTFFLYYLYSGEFESNATLLHMANAFSSHDERSIQKVFLVEGFKNYPLLGSGFGVGVEYLRSETSPWLYELTYHQLLFNFGLIGVTSIVTLISVYLYYVINFISKNYAHSGFAYCLLTGIIVFGVGAYSNPYFGSFDFLLLLGVLPLISATNQRYKVSRLMYLSEKK